MRKKIIALFTAMTLAFSMITVSPAATTVSAASVEDKEFACVCLATQADSGDKPLVTYGSKNVEKLTYDQAVAAGVPAGFSKNVVKVSGAYINAGIGTLLDFSGKKIPQNVVLSITFRVYVGYERNGSYPEFRIHRPGYANGDFITKTSIADNVKKWTEVTVDIDKNNIYGNASILDMCKDGYLDKCNLLIRLNGIEEFYIDSIRVGLKDNDKVGPVITCDDTLYFSEEEMPKVKAYDEMEDRDVDVEYIWPEDVVLGENKLPEAGEYSVTVRAKDYYGNVSEKTVTAIVVGKDKIKPEITVTSEEIYAVTGTYPLLSATATDDSGAEPTVTYSWSEGALDAAGRLTKGEHTWTITAKDSSNNVATKEVKVYVTDEENLGTNVIDEGAMYGNDSDHVMTYVAAKAATCTSAGNIAYYYCSGCGKYFADKAGSKEISKVSTVVKAKGHKAVKVKGWAATFTSNGLTDGSKCSVCGKVIVAQKKINKLAKPSKTKFTKVVAGKKKVSIKFKKIKNISGYQLQIARNKSMKKNLKTYNIKSSKTTYTIKKLKSKTTYYVRIRTYKKVNSETGYSGWTKVTKVKVK